MYGGHYVYYKCYELQIVAQSLAGREQKYTLVSAKTPVVVLARAVYTGKRLFVQKHSEVVSACDFVHNRHQQQVMVVGQVCFLKYRSEFKLIGRHLVVACFSRDTQFGSWRFRDP